MGACVAWLVLMTTQARHAFAPPPPSLFSFGEEGSQGSPARLEHIARVSLSCRCSEARGPAEFARLMGKLTWLQVGRLCIC